METNNKKNTAPGKDGLIHKFYKLFKHKLVEHLTHLCNSILDNARMPNTWAETNLFLIHKIDKDPLHLRSYTPIALLNTDAKIFIKTLANRLRRIITIYIYPDQTGFMPTRHLPNNIRGILNIITYCQHHQIESIAFSIDLERAFNSMTISYLKQVLDHLQFENRFMNAIAALYSHPTALLKINYLSSETIQERHKARLSYVLVTICSANRGFSLPSKVFYPYFGDKDRERNA